MEIYLSISKEWTGNKHKLINSLLNLYPTYAFSYYNNGNLDRIIDAGTYNLKSTSVYTIERIAKFDEVFLVPKQGILFTDSENSIHWGIGKGMYEEIKQNKNAYVLSGSNPATSTSRLYKLTSIKAYIDPESWAKYAKMTVSAYDYKPVGYIKHKNPNIYIPNLLLIKSSI